MIILGIDAFHVDSSAALVQDGKLIAAAEEERFRRIKHWAGFLSESIAYWLRKARVQLSDVEHIAFEDNRANLLRKILYFVTKSPDINSSSASSATAAPEWIFRVYGSTHSRAERFVGSFNPSSITRRVLHRSVTDRCGPRALGNRSIHDALRFKMQVFQIREEKRKLIPGVTHVDGSVRPQRVSG